MKGICVFVGLLGTALLLLGAIAGDGGIWPLWACVATSGLGLALMQAGISGYKKSPVTRQRHEAKRKRATKFIIQMWEAIVNGGKAIFTGGNIQRKKSV